MNSYNECQAIVALDLDPIQVKIMHKESGEGWTLEQAIVVAAEYRRFLYLMKTFPNEMVAPSMDVDTFWHYHILDTMKYAQDCDEVFGYFLHHFPYVGLRGEEDLSIHEQVGERMAVLYEETFGEKYRSSLIGGTMVSEVNSDLTVTLMTTTAYSMSTTGKAATAYSMSTTGKAATAYSMSTAGRAATAYSMSTAGRAATAYSMSTTGKPATAYSMSIKSAAPDDLTGSTIQDRVGFPLRSRPSAFSVNAAETSANDDTLMHTFFSDRPRLPAQVQAA